MAPDPDKHPDRPGRPKPRDLPRKSHKFKRGDAPAPSGERQPCRRTVNVRMRFGGRIMTYNCGSLGLDIGDWVVVKDLDILRMCLVTSKPIIWPANQERDGVLLPPGRQLLRLANDADLARQALNELRERESLEYCQGCIAHQGLPMKLVAAEITFDNFKTIFYYTSETRVDFRLLVKELVTRLRTRVEMRQIGVRNEALMLGGVGICGRPFCCAGFLSAFSPVSVRMAKEQNISLNTTKLSGVCGRLMCCLAFENYAEVPAEASDGEAPAPAGEAAPRPPRAAPAPEPTLRAAGPGPDSRMHSPARRSAVGRWRGRFSSPSPDDRLHAPPHPGCGDQDAGPDFEPRPPDFDAPPPPEFYGAPPPPEFYAPPPPEFCGPPPPEFYAPPPPEFRAPRPDIKAPARPAEPAEPPRPPEKPKPGPAELVAGALAAFAATPEWCELLAEARAAKADSRAPEAGPAGPAAAAGGDPAAAATDPAAAPEPEAAAAPAPGDGDGEWDELGDFLAGLHSEPPARPAADPDEPDEKDMDEALAALAQAQERAWSTAGSVVKTAPASTAEFVPGLDYDLEEEDGEPEDPDQPDPGSGDPGAWDGSGGDSPSHEPGQPDSESGDAAPPAAGSAFSPSDPAPPEGLGPAGQAGPSDPAEPTESAGSDEPDRPVESAGPDEPDEPDQSAASHAPADQDAGQTGLSGGGQPDSQTVSPSGLPTGSPSDSPSEPPAGLQPAGDAGAGPDQGRAPEAPESDPTETGN